MVTVTSECARPCPAHAATRFCDAADQRPRLWRPPGFSAARGPGALVLGRQERHTLFVDWPPSRGDGSQHPTNFFLTSFSPCVPLPSGVLPVVTRWDIVGVRAVVRRAEKHVGFRRVSNAASLCNHLAAAVVTTSRSNRAQASVSGRKSR